MCFKISLKRLENCNRATDESNQEGDSVKYCGDGCDLTG